MIKGLFSIPNSAWEMSFLRILLFFLSNVFLQCSIIAAEKIPLDLYEKVRGEAKDFYSGIDRGSDCLWEYSPYDIDRSHGYSKRFKFGGTTFYSLGCIYGMYNYWSVWMKEKPDGNLIPLTFSYPFYIDGYVEGQEDPSQMIGMSTTRLLCNPTVDEEKMTITTKCLGRGIGDYFDSGTWQYIGHKDYGTDFDIKEDFLLIKFESDSIDDLEERPVTLYEVVK